MVLAADQSGESPDRRAGGDSPRPGVLLTSTERMDRIVVAAHNLSVARERHFAEPALAKYVDEYEQAVHDYTNPFDVDKYA